MRIRLLLPAAAVVALVAAPAPASADPALGAAATKRCSAKGSKTVVKNRFARVFTKSPNPDTATDDEVQRLYGCLYSNGRRWRLDTARDDELYSSASYNAIKLTGRFVAWQHSEYDGSCKDQCPPGYNPSKTHLRVANLRKRRIKRVDGNLGEGTALVVTSTGAIAWIQPGSPVSVRKADADGTDVLYEGDDIDGGSLTRSDRTVAWVAGGRAMSATLH